MAGFGKGIATRPHPDGDIWEIVDGGNVVAIFDHAVFHDIQDGAPIFYSLPLGPGGRASSVWLQSAFYALVQMALPTNGATSRAQSLLEDRINEAFRQIYDSGEDIDAGVERLKGDLRGIRGAAEATDSRRLTARSF